MAGETTKTAALTSIEAGEKGDGKALKMAVIRSVDTHAFTTGELEAADKVEYAIQIPSNAVIHKVEAHNDDLDSDGSPAVTIDIGLVAARNFNKVVSGVKSLVKDGDVLDADLLVDGSTVAQSATTKWTLLDMDTATAGADKAVKEVWELLGYDENPRTIFNVLVTVATAATAAQAGDFSLAVEYSVPN
jgi:hypothetical protein